MVVFPRTRMTLSIAREKSMRAVEEAMMQPRHVLCYASQRDPEIDDPQPKDIYPTGTLAEITTMHRQQDGSLQVLFNGLRRVRLKILSSWNHLSACHVSMPEETQQRSAGRRYGAPCDQPV